MTMTAIMLHHLHLARRHAVVILTSMAMALAGIPARAQSGTAARPLWTANGRPTRQALAVIGILGNVAARGLDPRDYDSAGLATMARTLDARSDSTQLARFDVALSRSVMRLL